VYIITKYLEEKKYNLQNLQFQSGSPCLAAAMDTTTPSERFSQCWALASEFHSFSTSICIECHTFLGAVPCCLHLSRTRHRNRTTATAGSKSRKRALVPGRSIALPVPSDQPHFTPPIKGGRETTRPNFVDRLPAPCVRVDENRADPAVFRRICKQAKRVGLRSGGNQL
jgi:hypothetical protein